MKYTLSNNLLAIANLRGAETAFISNSDVLFHPTITRNNIRRTLGEKPFLRTTSRAVNENEGVVRRFEGRLFTFIQSHRRHPDPSVRLD